MQQSENRIIAVIQYQAIFDKISQIDACLEMIPTILRSFPNNTMRLLENIDDQLRIYGNLDTDLTNLVFVRSPATSQQNSLIDSIVSLCTPESQSCKIASSTNQVIFEFYKHIMVYIAKGKEFQTLSYQIKQILTEVDRSEDIEFVNNKAVGNMQKIMTSINMTMTRYKDPKHLKSHLKLIRYPSEGSNYVRLQRVMYNAIFWEDQLNKAKSCDKTCPDYNGNYITHQHCKGRIYNCAYCAGTAGHHKNTYQVYSVILSYYIYLFVFNINYNDLNNFSPHQIDTIQHIIHGQSGTGKTLIICLPGGIPGL